ncbi:protein MAIN-LIKE 1-like [Arachis hypogaea]|uniref:protein MAIN-LIKE 1-like n=1 Tax=Arachis hypogaea TaxID=3818 RepID=UPI003B2187B0
MRRKHGMPLDDRIMPYLQMAGLAHFARLNNYWFRLDEPLVSAFVERWCSKTHTFHLSFGECIITLQDVAYQLGLPIDGQYVSRCLTDSKQYIEGGRGMGLETFSDLPEGADEETVRRYARACIMILLSMQLFNDKSGTHMHIRWLPYVARLKDMGRYSW